MTDRLDRPQWFPLTAGGKNHLHVPPPGAFARPSWRETSAPYVGSYGYNASWHANPRAGAGRVDFHCPRGGYQEVDTFGQEFYTKRPDLVFFLRSLCDAGFANRIIISVDCNWHWENGRKVFEGAGPPNFDPNADKRTYAYMMTDAVRMLVKSGFSRKEIDTFLVDNPRRFFCGV